MNDLVYKPKVKNKYNLDLKTIKNLKIGDRSKLLPPLCWRNDVISAWCISESIGNSKFCDETEYWMGFYDLDAPSYSGKFRVSFSTFGGMCSYNFNKFYNPKTINNINDLKIQEMFLKKINYLIDNGILVIGE